MNKSTTDMYSEAFLAVPYLCTARESPLEVPASAAHPLVGWDGESWHVDRASGAQYGTGSIRTCVRAGLCLFTLLPPQCRNPQLCNHLRHRRNSFPLDQHDHSWKPW